MTLRRLVMNSELIPKVQACSFTRETSRQIPGSEDLLKILPRHLLKQNETSARRAPT